MRFATLLGAPAEAADSLLRAPLTAESLLGGPVVFEPIDQGGLRLAYGGNPNPNPNPNPIPIPNPNPNPIPIPSPVPNQASS